MTKEHLQDGLKVFVVPLEVLDDQNLDIYEVMTYVVLRSHANARTGTAWPSYETIAREGRMSRRKAIDCVESLIQKGYLRKKADWNVTKNRKIRHAANIYTVTLPSAQHALGVVHDMHQGGAQHAPEQIKKNKTRKNNNKNNNKQNVVVVPESFKSFLAEKGLSDAVSEKTLNEWFHLEDEHVIRQAITETLQKDGIENVVGYITGILRKGYTPSVSTGSRKPSGVMMDKLPESVQWQLEQEKIGSKEEQERMTVQDDPELKAMLVSLRQNKKSKS